MKVIYLSLFFFTLSIFAACQSVDTKQSDIKRSDAKQSEIRQVSVEEAKQAIEKTNAQFVDVRTKEEYSGGHAVKTVNLPLDSLESDLTRLDKDKPVYVICQTGRRSQKGSEILQKAGFTEIYNIEGGTAAWQTAGLPLEK